MIKRILVGFYLIATLSVTNVKAQQHAMYTQYMFNTLAINPAYAGSRNVLSATALFRSQWSGMDGAPRTNTFTMDAPLNNKKIGLGFQVFKDKLGVNSTTGAVATYAYRIRMREASLAFGLQGSISQYRADNSRVVLEPFGFSSDDQAFANDINTSFYNFGAGVYYNSDRFYAGLSSPQLLQNILPSYAENQSRQNRQYYHLFLMTGYVVGLGQDFKLKPSALLKAVKGAPVEADLNLNLWVKDAFSIGAQYRTNADVSAMVELQVNPKIRLGYAYDYSLTNLRSINSGSHEIMLRYEFGSEKTKVITPRYF